MWKLVVRGATVLFMVQGVMFLITACLKCPKKARVTGSAGVLVEAGYYEEDLPTIRGPFSISIHMETTDEGLSSYVPVAPNAVYAIQECDPPEIVNPIDRTTLRCYLDQAFVYNGDSIAPGVNLTYEARDSAHFPGIEVQVYTEPVHNIVIDFTEAFLSQAVFSAQDTFRFRFTGWTTDQVRLDETTQVVFDLP